MIWLAAEVTAHGADPQGSSTLEDWLVFGGICVAVVLIPSIASTYFFNCRGRRGRR